jgi:hypothetical protein
MTARRFRSRGRCSPRASRRKAKFHVSKFQETHVCRRRANVGRPARNERRKIPRSSKRSLNGAPANHEHPRSAPTTKGAFATSSTVSQVAPDCLEGVSWQARELGHLAKFHVSKFQGFRASSNPRLPTGTGLAAPAEIGRYLNLARLFPRKRFFVTILSPFPSRYAKSA